MDAINQFFAMGGYAGFVWPSYGLGAVVMGALLVVTLRTLRKSEAELKLLQDSRPDRAARRAARKAEAGSDA